MEINLDERIRRFARLYPRIMNWPISRMNDSETKERGLLRVKIQWGILTDPPRKLVPSALVLEISQYLF